MAKQNRGKAIGKLTSRGRGTCPVCYTTRTKLLYKRKKNNGVTLNVCKKCINVSEEKLNQVQPVPTSLAFRRKHRTTFYRIIEQQRVKESS